VLLNTSFNRSEPIVASPTDAIECYLKSGIDVLVLGDYYVSRRGPTCAEHPVEHAAPAPARHALPVALTARAT
jgi:carbamoyltransferase